MPTPESADHCRGAFLILSVFPLFKDVFEFWFGADLDFRLLFKINSDLLFVILLAGLTDTRDPLILSVVAYGLPILDADDCLDCVFALQRLKVVLTVEVADGHLLLERLLTPLEKPDEDVISPRLCLVYFGTRGRSRRNILN